MPQAPLATAARRPSALITLLLLAGAALFLLPQGAAAQTSSPSPTASPADRPVLGILGLTVPENRGVAIARVLPDSGADEGGLRSGDIIVELEGNRISSMDDLTSAMETFSPGDEVTVTYERDGENRTAEVELGSSRQQRQRSPFEVLPGPERVPDFPDRPERPDAQAPVAGPDYRPVIILFGLLITGALIALTVVLARKNRPGPEAPVATAAYVPPGGSGKAADAKEVLRVRYAKGEISREEFLRMSADLNGNPPTTSSESPTTEQ